MHRTIGTWYAVIEYRPAYGHHPTYRERWDCGHSHSTEGLAARCGNAQVRRLTAGHNIAALNFEARYVASDSNG